MTETELRGQNFPFPAKTLVRAIEMDDKTRIARKIPDIPPGEIVEVKEIYSNFYGVFAQVKWAGYPGRTYSLKPETITPLPPGTVVPTKKDKETKEKLGELSKSLSLIAEALFEYDPTQNVSVKKERDAYRLLAVVLLAERIREHSLGRGGFPRSDPEILESAINLWLKSQTLPRDIVAPILSEEDVHESIGKIASNLIDDFMPKIKQEFCR